MPPAFSPQVAKAIAAWKASFAAFLPLLWIIDRDADADADVPLVRLSSAVRPVQKRVLKFFLANRWSFLLKARRMGCTTILAAYFFWRWLFTPNLKIAVIAHTYEAAEGIFAIYKRFYDNLPDWLRAMFPCDTSNVREMRLFHGALIKVYSAQTESIRGDGYNIIHATEVAQWRSFVRTVRSAFQAADGRARVIMETTANGPNEVWQFWNGAGEFQRAGDFAKLFLPWSADDDYRMEALHADAIPPPKDAEERAWELEYQATYGLDDLQVNWLRWCLRRKCLGSYTTLDQEYPPTATTAFLLSGRPFFAIRYDEVAGKEPVLGRMVFEAPLAYVPYLAGIDTATGSPDGDFSALSIWRVMAKGDPFDYRLVLSLYVRQDIVPFCEAALAACKEYNAFTTIESNGPGAAVVQWFKHADYPHLYRSTSPVKIGQEGLPRVGYATTDTTRAIALAYLQGAVNMSRLDFSCPRLKGEINTFAFDKRGIPDHQPGAHSDAIMASAFALAGRLQAGDYYLHDSHIARRPTTAEERIAFEIRTGILVEDVRAWGDDPRAARLVPSLSTMLGAQRLR